MELLKEAIDSLQVEGQEVDASMAEAYVEMFKLIQEVKLC